MTVDASSAVPSRAGTPRLKPSASAPLDPRPLPANRRTSRPPTTDPLSDRATQALIRRTLCPQQSRDKGRDAPPPIHDLLPPLTSRNDVDLELYAFLAIILRDFVQSWYGNITADESFVAEIVHIVAHCSRALEQRLRKLDLESLVFDELPEVLDQHVAAHRPAAQPPLAIDPHQAYHSLWPLPLLSPVPDPGDAVTAAEQRENEAAYRQLLVQAVLAVLLPTEDLENPCLTALVGQIFSELIIAGVLVNKAAQPWLVFEAFTVLSSIWLLVESLAMSSSLPPRATRGTDRERKPGQSPGPPHPAKVPVLDFAAWRCAGNLIEMSSRMPWLGGFLSLLQFGAVHGPGRVAGLDRTLDRLLSHRIKALLSPARLSAALRTIRGVVFPNNAPGSSSLCPPCSEAELRALRRRAASAIWGMLPSGVARVYFGAGSPWQRRPGTAKEEEDRVLDDIEDLLMVLGDEYCNKHLVYGLLELLLVRLIPELSEKGVLELWDERLG
ncbi:PXA domain-containing protein [Hirsutella rhossiliensis]|uniref:PXA domain-containing protein n=1 Tax=Hirsutella rhossiliensis TaxID=111463 RepID=A0A9P8SKU3_9HYPO|nr:PXA domain-containing protein [Hirsutella rhossiliensis]KAH0966768.1 PXA domain-containing protein [Hirsutella rhossiliensis]